MSLFCESPPLPHLQEFFSFICGKMYRELKNVKSDPIIKYHVLHNSCL